MRKASQHMHSAMEEKNPGWVPVANEKIDLPIEDNDDEETDDEIMSLLENKYFGAPRRSLQNLRRLKYVKFIHAEGFRYSSRWRFPCL